VICLRTVLGLLQGCLMCSFQVCGDMRSNLQVPMPIGLLSWVQPVFETAE
jgi:hypothetical protein